MCSNLLGGPARWAGPPNIQVLSALLRVYFVLLNLRRNSIMSSSYSRDISALEAME